MDMDRLAGRYRQLQRATVARSALDVIALIFLVAGFAFWAVAFWQLLTPPALLSLLSIQAAVLALAFSLAAPLLLSMLVPTTPAGQLLQKTQWATVGFYVILAAAIFMTFQAEQLIESWLYAQPAIAESGFERRLAIVLVIAFVVIPALAWVQLTPERWLQQIQQAHAVKKLEMQQRGELAIVKASILSAERKALLGWANLLPLEQQEVLHTIRGLIMASAIPSATLCARWAWAPSWSAILWTMRDRDQLDYVAQRLDVLPDVRPPTHPPRPATRARSRARRPAPRPRSPAPPLRGSPPRRSQRQSAAVSAIRGRVPRRARTTERCLEF
jgi:hypothetical protein